MNTFKQAVRDVFEIEECHVVAGRFDYLVKTRSPDMGACRKILGGSERSIKSKLLFPQCHDRLAAGADG